MYVGGGRGSPAQARSQRGQPVHEHPLHALALGVQDDSATTPLRDLMARLDARLQRVEAAAEEQSAATKGVQHSVHGALVYMQQKLDEGGQVRR